MNLVDSSGWLEYFAGESKTQFFAAAIEDTDRLLVSAINLYEVAKRLEHLHEHAVVMRFIKAMQRGKVVPVDEFLALRAVELSIQHKLPMADSLILATAYTYDATLWTQDAHFASIAGVQYIAKQ